MYIILYNFLLKTRDKGFRKKNKKIFLNYLDKNINQMIIETQE